MQLRESGRKAKERLPEGGRQARVTRRLSPAGPMPSCPVTSEGPGEQCLGEEGNGLPALGREPCPAQIGERTVTPPTPPDLRQAECSLGPEGPWGGWGYPCPNLWLGCYHAIGREFLPPRKGPGRKKEKGNRHFSATLGSDATSINHSSTMCPELPSSHAQGPPLAPHSIILRIKPILLT